MMLHTRTAQISSVAGRQAGPPQEPDEIVRRLEAAHDREIECIFRILSLLYPDTDFRSAHYGLRSGDITARDHALEFLELNIDGGLRKTLVSLLDPTAPPDEQLLPALRRTGASTPTPQDLTAALVASDDPWLKACGLRSIGVLGLVELAVHVESSIDAEDPLLRETARAAKRQLAQRGAG
jgi:AAA family ATP:ADP antiporter